MLDTLARISSLNPFYNINSGPRNLSSSVVSQVRSQGRVEGIFTTYEAFGDTIVRTDLLSGRSRFYKADGRDGFSL